MSDLSASEYLKLLRALLIEEKGKTPEEVQALFLSHPSVMTHALEKRQRFTLRAVAMALEFPPENGTAETKTTP